MKNIYYALIILIVQHSTFASYNSSLEYNTNDVSKINKYSIDIPSSFEQHTMGFSPGIGSSITLKGIKSDGCIELYAICDRGPNYTITELHNTHNTIIFPRPTFSPFVGIITITPQKSATLTEIISLKINGQKITGLITPEINSFSIPTDLNFKLVPADPNGFDTESIDIDSEGNFWIGDEYRPSLIKAQIASGEISEILTPGNGLPEILKHCPQNRGFEALAVAPNGKIYAAMESILDFAGNTKTSANFIRIIELDPKTKQTKIFAYPYDKSTYTSPLAAKIGDMAAIDDTHFLIIEQGKTPSGMRNIIYIIDISNATDISHTTLPNDLPLEYASIDELSNINFIKKSPIFNALDYKWPHEKLEGIAIINQNTIAITNDNDFGFSLSINGVNSERVIGYNVDYSTQKLLRYGKETQDKVDVNIQKDASTDLWIIELKKNLKDIMCPEKD